jgi:hypothetical protein
MGWSDVAFLTDGAVNNALANREEEPRGQIIWNVPTKA